MEQTTWPEGSLAGPASHGLSSWWRRAGHFTRARCTRIASTATRGAATDGDRDRDRCPRWSALDPVCCETYAQAIRFQQPILRVTLL